MYNEYKSCVNGADVWSSDVIAGEAAPFAESPLCAWRCFGAGKPMPEATGFPLA